MAEIVVFYHGGDCLDGLLSAFTIWKDTGGKAVLYPIQPGQSPIDVTQKIVYVLDVCFSKEILLKMISQAKAFLIIDHHESSWNDIKDIPDKFKIWNQKECTCVLLWKYLYPQRPVPDLYKYVQANDLWKKDELPNVDAVILAFSKAVTDENSKLNINLVEKYLTQTGFNGLIEKGLVFHEFQNYELSKILSHICFYPIRRPAYDDKKEKIIIVAYLNCGFFISNLSEKCFKEYPFVDLFVCYYIDGANQQTQVCLRSTDDREDALWIAQQFGGGGHRNSAAFRVNNLTCRLNFEHLDPVPFLCMFKRKTYLAKWDNLAVLTAEYLNILKTKFPDREFNMKVLN